MIGKGLFKADDYYHFGKLIDELIEAGAVNIIVAPRKGLIIASFRRSDEERADRVVFESGKEFTKKPALKGKVLLYAIRW